MWNNAVTPLFKVDKPLALVPVKEVCAVGAATDLVIAPIC